MFNSSLVRRAARSAPTVSARPTAPSIAPFTSRAHQRRHSSSKPPVPPNNGSPTIPADVKQVAPRSEAKSESKKPAERSSKRKVAKAEATEENWTSSLPSVPSTAHMSQKDVNVAAFYATHRPISITSPTGPREAQLRDIEQIFSSKPTKSRAKQANEVDMTISSFINRMEAQAEAGDKGAEGSNGEGSASAQKELFRVVDGSGNHFKIVTAPQNPHRPFRPPPVPTPLTQPEIDALERQAASAEDAGEDALAAQLESDVVSQDPRIAAAQGRRDRAKLDAILNAPKGSQTAQIVFNTTMKTLRERFSFFTPTEPAPVQEPVKQTTVGRRRRGFTIQIPGKRKVIHAISVKRQRRLKMKKHKYKKLMRRTRNLRRREGRL